MDFFCNKILTRIFYIQNISWANINKNMSFLFYLLLYTYYYYTKI